jgi:serine/threonine protein kinase
MKEIQILEECDSPYVVGYLGAYMKDGDLWIVMEYCAAGSLTDLMTIADVTLNEVELRHAIAGTLLGLEYLHSTRLIHRVCAHPMLHPIGCV